MEIHSRFIWPRYYISNDPPEYIRTGLWQHVFLQHAANEKAACTMSKRQSVWKIHWSPKWNGTHRNKAKEILNVVCVWRVQQVNEHTLILVRCACACVCMRFIFLFFYFVFSVRNPTVNVNMSHDHSSIRFSTCFSFVMILTPFPIHIVMHSYGSASSSYAEYDAFGAHRARKQFRKVETTSIPPIIFIGIYVHVSNSFPTTGSSFERT